MTKYVINGGKTLNGEVTISGAKNAAVAIVPAALLADGPVRLENVPKIIDVTLQMEIMRELGAQIRQINATTEEIQNTQNPSLKPHELERKLRRTAGEQTAAETAARMEEIGLVDDGAYAARLAEELAARRFYPRRRILQELQEKGIGRAQAEAAAEAVDGEDWERAAQLLRRKYARRLHTPDDRRRTMAALGRYGFGGDAVRRAFDALRGEEPDWFAEEDTPEE